MIKAQRQKSARLPAVSLTLPKNSPTLRLRREHMIQTHKKGSY